MREITISAETIRQLKNEVRRATPEEAVETIDIELQQEDVTLTFAVEFETKFVYWDEWHSEVGAYEPLSDSELIRVTVTDIVGLDEDDDQVAVSNAQEVASHLEYNNKYRIL